MLQDRLEQKELKTIVTVKKEGYSTIEEIERVEKPEIYISVYLHVIRIKKRKISI